MPIFLPRIPLIICLYLLIIPLLIAALRNCRFGAGIGPLVFGT
jgi:hypothetical protein